MHSLPADAAGNVLSYADAAGEFKIFIGLDDVSASFALSTVGNPQALTVNYSGQAYTVTGGLDVDEPEASLTILATGTGAFAGLSLPKVFSLAKSLAGADGAPAKTLTVLSDRQTIAYDAAGVPSPTVQTTTFSTNRQNTAATVNWSVMDANGTPRAPVTAYLSAATGDTVTMTEAQFAAARNGTTGVTVTASVSDGGTIMDRISVVRVASGTQPLSGNLLRDSIFANGEAVGWAFVTAGGMVASGSINPGGDAWRPVGENVIGVQQPNAGSAGYADWRASINVEAGRWYEVSIYAGLHRCSGTLYLAWYDAGGTFMSATSSSIPAASGGTQLSAYARASVKGKAPAGAVSAHGFLRKLPTSAGQMESYAFFTRPQIVETTENAPSPVPYSPSGVGTKGEDGLSIAELTIYRRAATVPAVPTGGGYNLATKVLTPPASWSTTRPAPNGNALYEARGVAFGTSGSVAPVWSGVALAAQDGDATNVIFRRSAPQPSTPAPSAGVPSGWSDDPASATGSGPMWSSFGTRTNGGANWTWLQPKQIEGEDGISPILITVNPPSLALQGTATGIPMAGQLPRSVQVSAMRGGLGKPVTSISVTGTSGCSVGVAGANLTFTAVNPGGGFATIDVTSDGETISGIKVPVTVGVGGTDAATSLAMSYSGAVTSSTYVALGDPVAMNANASGQLRVSASSTYYATYPTIATLAIKLQVSIDGGAWTDIAGAEVVGEPTSTEPPSSTYPGAAFISPVFATGLGPNKPCQVRMLIRKNTAINASSSASRLLVEKP